jgi:transcriptional regulator, AsnC family
MWHRIVVWPQDTPIAGRAFPDYRLRAGGSADFPARGRRMTRDELDAFDQAILRILQQDGRISVTDLAGRINLSKSPTQTRLRRLEKAGFIAGYQALLDHERLGLGHVAFVEVKLSDTREAALRAFNTAVRGVVEVEECHMIAGAFDYLLKVRSADIMDIGGSWRNGSRRCRMSPRPRPMWRWNR